MLRRLQVISNKPAEAMLKANTNMVRGMAVQKDLANGEVVLPTSQTGLYFVTKEDYATGVMAYEGELSSYDERLDNIKEGEFVVLEKPMSGERYATDQFVSNGLTVGDYLAVEDTVADNNLGKWIKSTDATSFIYGGEYKDNGHTLAIIQVL